MLRALSGHCFLRKEYLSVATFLLRSLQETQHCRNATCALRAAQTIYDQPSRGLTVVGWAIIYRMSLANCVQSGTENKPSLDFRGDFHTWPNPEIVPNNTLHWNSGALECDAASTDKWSPAFSKDWHLKPLKMKAPRYLETSDTTKRCCVTTQETENLDYTSAKNSPLPRLTHLAPCTTFLSHR
jgi:hypothetical protein